MELKVAETAGFCFGVARALRMVDEAVEAGEKRYCTLGPIIHNRQVVEDLEKKGVKCISDVDEAPENTVVVVRTHGVPKSVCEKMEAASIEYMDVTCPFVKKIHKIVCEYYNKGYKIIIIGDKDHPEVIGINGWCSNSAIIIEDEEQAKALPDMEENVCIVVQTTFDKNILKKIKKILKKTCKSTIIFDTICSATEERQAEAQKLAAEVDVMFVIGGKNSSNTKKLYNICKSVCKNTYFLESINDFQNFSDLKNKKVGITAGASTPAGIIKEAINRMENQENFETLIEESLKTLNTGDVVTGTVIEVGPTEVIVDLKVKQDGFIPASEISDDPNLAPEDVVKVGDEIEVFVVRVNDSDGNIMLSRRKLDSMKTWESIKKAFEDGTVLEGKVTDVVNGGMIVTYKSNRVFVPSSHANDRYLSDLSSLIGKVVPFVIIDINERRRRIVGSVKNVLMEQKRELEAKFWESAEVGKKYQGIVKSLTNFGAFVDIGGIDGLVHISELSWTRIKHPSDVLSVGDSIEVYIKDINEETKKISLGFKKAEDNPWEIAKSKLNVDDIITVKIVRMLPFGAFAEIMPSIDGLIHISQIANKRIGKPQDELEIGQEVQVKITEIDWEAKKIGLSIRALLPEEPKEVKEEAAPAEAEQAEEAEEVPVYKEELDSTIGDAVDISVAAANEENAVAAEEENTAAEEENTDNE